MCAGANGRLRDCPLAEQSEQTQREMLAAEVPPHVWGSLDEMLHENPGGEIFESMPRKTQVPNYVDIARRLRSARCLWPKLVVLEDGVLTRVEYRGP